MSKKFCSLEPLIPYYQLKHPFDWEKIFNRPAPLDVEVGFGVGEFLVQLAQKNKERNVVGIEQIWERIYKTLKRIDDINEHNTAQEKITNIRVLDIEAQNAFKWLFSPKTIHKIYCLFPCPWPKRAHRKHRLFNEEFLALANNRLKSGGEVLIVTDHEPYLEWMAQSVKRSGFSFFKEVTKPKYNTKFEKKWVGQGQKNFYEVRLCKEKHIHVDIGKGGELKSYTLADFSPKNFHFTDSKGDISVILKETLYDQEQLKMLVLVVVAEAHITQYLWVAIQKEKSVWKVARVNGQQFFPTPGVAKAIELVYRAALESA